MKIRTVVVAFVLAAVVGGWMAPPQAQTKPAAVKTPRLYIFDNGDLKGLDPKRFGFTREQLAEVDFVNRSYLIVHPRGTVMFDTGGIPDSAFPTDGSMAKSGIMTADKKLAPQLAAVGYKPSDITYLVMSHYHADHTGNANLFAGATWIVQKAERDVMFSGKQVPILAPDTYSALRNSKTKTLNHEDFDIFGDGTLVIKSTPGHTPGHQVLVVKLAKFGPVILSGDMYHYPEEIATGKTPDFEDDPPTSAKSRAALQAFAKQTGATLWIEHDKPTHAKLPKAPAYVD
jgi:glyoxylase-like metal-dependent hydrolase (beta-lactamase superfamily II)